MAAPLSLYQAPVRTPSRMTSAFRNDAGSTAELNDSNSSDDEGGVFFGSRDPREALLVAELSSKPTPRRSPLAPLKKRDSREFLRRQTILFSAKKGADVYHAQERAWSGGFYEKGVTPRVMEDLSDDEDTGSSKASNHDESPTPTEHASDLTFEFSNFRLTDREPACVEDDTQGVDDGEDHGGSDKENEVSHSSHRQSRSVESSLFAAFATSNAVDWVGAELKSKDSILSWN